jgi:serine kinase of HPr protein (carbohydrate metabolism regulator)
MFTLQTILNNIELNVLTDPLDYSEIEILSGYTSDLLSCVMTGAKADSIWVTLIANINIVAVASLLEIPAIIITENAHPDAATIARANQEGIVLLSTPAGSYQVVGKLWQLGIKDTHPSE